MENNQIIARTGRVQTWIDDPKSRLPVSCTVFVVEDSMEGSNGIEASWRFVSHALRYGAGVAVHLSKLRASGTDNGKGLVASGPVSFGKIYSCLNEQLRRGGVYKNGAVVLHLDVSHPDILDFINTPRHELPWAKRCVNLNTELWDNTSDEVKDSILKGISRGDIWLAKIRKDQYGRRIYANVCLEVFLRSRGTCLLQHVNLGACRTEDLVGAFTGGMNELISLHTKTGVESTGEYLTQEEDRQVGLGMLGLANLLALEGVTYAQFGEALTAHLYPEGDYLTTPEARKIVTALQDGITAAASIARTNNMDRAFAIAPTASCSYRYRDRAGYTTAPEIAPPIGRTVDRDSSTFGVESFFYGEIETAEQVGWDDYVRVVDGIMEMLNRTGLAHGYSYNSWSDVVTYDDVFIEKWLQSPQTSLYYSLQVMQNTQAKDDAMAALDGDFSGIFGFDDTDPDDNDHIIEMFNDPQACVGCAE
tara:strand:+ start:1418 stop:2845 length:1428 start_codon:yes stop_codon:yes gene_type:complete